MRLKILSIKDRALEAFMRPFYAQSVGQGTRMFTDIVNEPNSDMNKHPTDYELYLLGEWDDQNGHTKNETEGQTYDSEGTNDNNTKPKLIARGEDVLNK